MIEVKGLQKSYGGRLVLDIGQFHFERGVRYALIGSNGSGKSTLLRILAGALPADAGAAEISREDRRQMGYMPQRPYAFGFSVLRNVAIAHPRPRAAEKPARQALEKVGLLEMADAKGNRLSGGETQRMALARVLLQPHSLLLLDEPTAAADIAATEKIEQALLAYWEETRCTLLFSSHAPSQVARLAQVVLMLDEGRLVEWGEAGQLLRAPKQPQTQKFLQHWRL